LEGRHGALHYVNQRAIWLSRVGNGQAPNVEAVLPLHRTILAAQQLGAAVRGVQPHQVLALVQHARPVSAAAGQRVNIHICR
jgi:hypothetical protein